MALLFAQMAVSAYACPGADGMSQAQVVVDEDPPCHERPASDVTTPLCQAHCQQGDQSMDPRGASLPAVFLVALPASWLLVRVHPADASQAPATQASLLERPTGPPLAVRNCCLRI